MNLSNESAQTQSSTASVQKSPPPPATEQNQLPIPQPPPKPNPPPKALSTSNSSNLLIPATESPPNLSQRTVDLSDPERSNEAHQNAPPSNPSNSTQSQPVSQETNATAPKTVQQIKQEPHSDELPVFYFENVDANTFVTGSGGIMLYRMGDRFIPYTLDENYFFRPTEAKKVIDLVKSTDHQKKPRDSNKKRKKKIIPKQEKVVQHRWNDSNDNVNGPNCVDSDFEMLDVSNAPNSVDSLEPVVASFIYHTMTKSQSLCAKMRKYVLSKHRQNAWGLVQVKFLL